MIDTSDMEKRDAGIIAPPWDLKGRGYMLFYRFKESFIFNFTSLPSRYRDTLISNYGVVMLVDYTNSPMGSYKELLLIPGKFDLGGKPRYYISKIYVDSEISMVSGQYNWGIPKELAAFTWDRSGSNESITVTKSGNTIFSIQLSAGMMPVPINTSLLPIQLYQEYEGHKFFVSPNASGVGRKARVTRGMVDEQHFPDIFQFSPWLAVKVDPFKMYFPPAKMD